MTGVQTCPLPICITRLTLIGDVERFIISVGIRSEDDLIPPHSAIPHGKADIIITVDDAADDFFSGRAALQLRPVNIGCRSCRKVCNVGPLSADESTIFCIWIRRISINGYYIRGDDVLDIALVDHVIFHGSDSCYRGKGGPGGFSDLVSISAVGKGVHVIYVRDWVKTRLVQQSPKGMVACRFRKIMGLHATTPGHGRLALDAYLIDE